VEGFGDLGMRNTGQKPAARKASANCSSGDYRSIDAFCGAGGLTLGLEWAGFTTAAAFDVDEKAIESFNLNIGSPGFVADASALTGSALLERVGLKVGELDLFAGGPPCQGFSKQKRGAHHGDDRNKLVLEFARLVRECLPRFFLIENVDQLGQKRGREFVEGFKEHLRDYVLHPRFYNSADYGIAQTRGRFVLVGKRSDLKTPYRSPKPTVSDRSNWLTVGEVLDGLPEPPEDYSDHPEFPNHQRARVTPINIERFSHVPQGGGWIDIPMHLRLDCHQTEKPTTGGWPDVYGRLRADGQCPTITGGFDSFTRGRYGHPYQDRPITPREAARLQGFPDSFRFCGTRAHIRHQIGNAVPPPLAEAVGRSILRALRVEDRVADERDLVDFLEPTPTMAQSSLPWF
jgi:DNA (cytosine-5)-methyltransferase 1